MSDDFKTKILQVNDLEFDPEPSSEEPSIKPLPALSKRQKAALAKRLRTRERSEQGTDDSVSMRTLPLPTKVLRESLNVMCEEDTDELNKDAQHKMTRVVFTQNNTPTVVESKRSMVTPDELRQLKDAWRLQNTQANAKRIASDDTAHNPGEPIPRSTMPVTSNVLNRMLDMAGEPRLSSKTLLVSGEQQAGLTRSDQKRTQQLRYLDEHKEGELPEDNTEQTHMRDAFTRDVFGDQHDDKARTQIIDASALGALNFNFDEED